MKKIKIFAVLVALLFAFPAFAADLASAKAQGVVGEKPDGMIAAVSAADAATQQMIDQVNAERLEKYKAIAEKNGAPVDQIRAVAGAKLIAQTPSGQYIMNAAGEWQKK